MKEFYKVRVVRHAEDIGAEVQVKDRWWSLWRQVAYYSWSYHGENTEHMAIERAKQLTANTVIYES